MIWKVKLWPVGYLIGFLLLIVVTLALFVIALVYTCGEFFDRVRVKSRLRRSRADAEEKLFATWRRAMQKREAWVTLGRRRSKRFTRLVQSEITAYLEWLRLHPWVAYDIRYVTYLVGLLKERRVSMPRP